MAAVISCRRFEETPLESFEVYLLGQAISFALVKGGLEPLHATCVVVEGQAIALLGDSGYGKSSLAACFLEAGHRLLTDDLLVAQEIPGVIFRPIPALRASSFSRRWRKAFLGESVDGVPMDFRYTKTHHAPGVSRGRSARMRRPSAAIYAMAAPNECAQMQGVRIESVLSRDAFVLLMNNIFNYVIVDSKRLQRQFKSTARLAAVAPVKRLLYPRLASALPLASPGSDYQRSSPDAG